MDYSASHTVKPEQSIPEDDGLSKMEAQALRSFWHRLFDLLDLNSTKARPNPTEAKDDSLEEMIAKHGRERYAEAFWAYTVIDDPDHAVIKFIRARNCQVENALKMLIECLQWRIEANVDSVVAKGERGFLTQEGYDGVAFTQQISSGKTFLQGFSKTGGPVSYVFARLHKPNDQSVEITTDFTIYTMENIRLLNSNLQSKVTLIFDLTGFGLSNMDWKTVSFFIKCLEAYYPESLDRAVIHNAPWIFQGIWKVLSSMLHPVVRSKIAFSKTNEDISEYVDKRYVLQEHGGSSTWKLSYEPPDLKAPELNEARKVNLMTQRKILVAKYIEATNHWLEGSSPRDAELRNLLVLMMRVQGLSLDPYLRRSTFYHRVGSVLPNGLVGFRSHNEQAECEYAGHWQSRERLVAKIEAMKARFKNESIEYPIIDFEL